MTELLAWDNGEIKPVSEVTLPITDRGVQCGDGLYETILVHPGNIPLGTYHLERLKKNCNRLGLPYPGDDTMKRALGEVLGATRDNKSGDEAEKTIAKIMMTAGDGEGLYRSKPIDPRLYVLLRPYNPEIDTWQKEGIRGWLQKSAGNSGSELATLKTLSRLGESLALEEVRKRAGGEERIEPLLVDEDHHLLQGAVTNIYLRIDDTWITPRTSEGVLPGVSRRVILEENSREEVREEALFTSDLLRADHVMVTNAVMGPVPIRTIVAPSLLRPVDDPLLFDPAPSDNLLTVSWKKTISGSAASVQIEDLTDSSRT